MSNGTKSQVSGCVDGMLTDPRAYFFSLIQRTEGSPAPDWKAVLESLPGKGMGINPRPGERQPRNAPHAGITVMIDAGNNARGRIWLPTDLAQTDHNGNQWFTHEIQVIADGPTPGSFVWAWEDKGGPPYAPRPCPQPSGTNANTNINTNIDTATDIAQGGSMVIDLRPLEARIQALERLVAAQADTIADLKKRPVASPAPSGGAQPRKIALKTDHGTYVTAESDGRMTNREDHPASWQTFKVEGMD